MRQEVFVWYDTTERWSGGGVMGHKKLESTLLYVHLVDTEVRAYQRNTPL
jgi:hypothetical protein